jgi:hypothetical protein
MFDSGRGRIFDSSPGGRCRCAGLVFFDADDFLLPDFDCFFMP